MSTNVQAQSPAIPIRQSFFPDREWARELRDSDTDPRARILGVMMAVFADPQTGEMFPSLPTLQLLCVNEEGKPWSESTVKRMRKLLVQGGWLELVRKGQGRGRASVYRLRFPEQHTPPENGSGSGSKNGSEPLGENGSGQTHQVHHEVHTSPTGREVLLESGPDTAPLRGSQSAAFASKAGSPDVDPPNSSDSNSFKSYLDQLSPTERREVYGLRPLFRQWHPGVPVPETLEELRAGTTTVVPWI